MQHSGISVLRQLCFGLVVLGLAGGAHAELGNPSTNTAACCQLTTSLVNDVLRGKDVSGDERFFSTDGASPNIHFLVDASSSMRELPQVVNSNHEAFFKDTINGCENPSLDAYSASRGWDPSFKYPVPDPGTGFAADPGYPNLFQDEKFYAYLYWTDSTNPPPQWNSAAEVCQARVVNWNTTGAADYNRCLECLSTKGYWKEKDAEGRNSGNQTSLDFVFWGRFLNFNPPKYVAAKAVLKSILKDVKRVRVGLSNFALNSNPALTIPLRPQGPSCSAIVSDSTAFNGLREDYIDAINHLSFNTGTPLGRSLLNVGYYFTSDKSVYETDFGFGSAYNYPSEFANAALISPDRSVCWGCQSTSVIIITDGEPSGDSVSLAMAAKLRALNGGPVYCPASQPCASGPLPSNRDMGPSDTVLTDDNQNYYLDDVAKFLYEKDLQHHVPDQVGDLNTEKQQRIVTYTVGFGVKSNLLKHTAEVGGGLYYTTQDANSLKQALLDIINTVQTRATSFSSPAASALQVGGASGTVVPRFEPARSKTEPWKGSLYRFKESPERLLGCDPMNPAAGGDLNQDGDCDDTLMIDKAGDAVTEDEEGHFVKLLSPLVPAQPIWEAGEKLHAEGPTRWKTRRIYTLIDNNVPGGDGKLDSRDTPVEFTEANAALLREYLGISDNPAACQDLADRLGLPSLSAMDCAKLVIRWYRGADALNPDPLLQGQDRPFLLGDIFHSSPAAVDPPMPKSFCSFSTQCLSALFSGSTPQQNGYTTPGRTDVLAYDKYEYEAGKRDKVLLVGANDGMLHSFLNGTKVSSSDDVDPFTGQRKYDDGTGEELWAFIPPDLLPKLRPNIGKHAYFVDGTAMVRDVWIDGVGGAKDNKKQWEEYRTVAVVGTGRGGVHRFALDLTRVLGHNPGDTANLAPSQQGDFLWMWPQPCDALALQVGESFTSFAPRPPPIGPVALTDDADQALRAFSGDSDNPGTGPWLIDNTPARERWVVALNGGFDEHMLRGRGMALVDLQSGHTVWSFFHGDGQSRSEHLRYPIGAGLSMMDIGKADSPLVDADTLWDSATVGDYGGQLWMVRLWKPGVWNAGKGQVDNWFAARAFRVANLAGKTGDAEALRAPFSFMTVNTLQPDTGFLRTFVGTGDRENLLEKGTACRLSNPRACAVQGCAVNNTLTVQRGGSTLYTTSAAYSGYHYTSGTESVGSQGNSCAGAEVTLTWNNDAANGCLNTNDGSIHYTCDGDTSSWSCRDETNTWAQLNLVQDTQPYPQRYYGVWTYGGTAPTRRFDTDAEASAYDDSLLTDSDLLDVGQFDNSGQVTSSPQAAVPTGKGWYIQYALDNERTGTSGTLQAGCVLWSSFEPSGATAAVCSTTGTNVARLYQANFATGLANCAVGFYDKGQDQWARYTESTTVAAPAEPAMQVSIGGGEVVLGISQQGPGQSTRAQIQRSDEGVKSLYQLELDPRGHGCRHEGVATLCD
ncbi:pilus assembly protein PilY [Hyalangium versicolor]|uniref:pilus assembly protein PilY n=1 Tax=Hyalangium versicolor TaxID=2861190 RepID=UPI001CCBB1FC|nr:pilus assembly protein PilY [Hyalangium versicolor]